MSSRTTPATTPGYPGSGPGPVEPTATRFGAGAVLTGALAVAAFMSSLVLPGVLTSSDAARPMPDAANAEQVTYVSEASGSIAMSGALQTVSGFTLALFAGVLAGYLSRNRLSVAAALTLLGGAVAGLTGALSGTVQLLLAQADPAAQAAVIPTLRLASFYLGGPLHVIWLAPMLGGAALLALRSGLAPRWLCYFGFVLAALSAAVLAAFFLGPVSPASVFIPLGRFGAFIWIIAAVVSLPLRARRTAAAAG